MAVRDILKNARTKRNLSQEKFAARLGVSKGAISNYERGTRIPELNKVMMWMMFEGWPRELALQLLEEHNYIGMRNLCQMN